MSPLPLILASSSAYRRSLLERLRLPFTVVTPEVDETALPGEDAERTALRLAESKARAAALQVDRHALIIGSDQVAITDGGVMLGKPGAREAAVRQLKLMRGRTTVFHTAVCVLDSASGRRQLASVRTTVGLRCLTDAQISRYVDLDQPYDCAGSARIESLGISLVERVASDDPTALIGLPLIALATMLAKEGVELP